MNLMNWLVLCVVFWFAGFGMMFGTHSLRGWVGTNLFWPAPGGQLVAKTNGSGPQLTPPSPPEEGQRVPGDVEAAYVPLNGLGLEFLLFQLAFAATTATIVDGALAERTAVLPYIAITVFVGIFIYPVFGHWAWNDASPSPALRTISNSGWLKQAWLSQEWQKKLTYWDGYGPHLGFHDFAGSTAVHSVGAWIALVGCKFVGSRRLTTPAHSPSKPYSLGYAVLGVIMLWFGWWGFNGGSLLKYDTTIASIILNTNLAGACAGLSSYFDALRRQTKDHNLDPYIFTVPLRKLHSEQTRAFLFRPKWRLDGLFNDFAFCGHSSNSIFATEPKMTLPSRNPATGLTHHSNRGVQYVK